MKYAFFIFFLTLVSQLQAQFAPEKFCRNGKFELAPLATSNTVTLKALYTLQAQESGTQALEMVTEAERVEVRIFDVFGIMVFRKLLPADFKEFSLDFTDLSAGAYVVEVRQGWDILSTKIIRRHH